MQRHPSRSDVDEGFDEGDEEDRAEEADDHPLGPATLWDHEAHEQSRRPEHHPDGDEQPPDPTAVGEVPVADASDELERRQRQVDTSKHDVHRHEGRVAQEAGVVGLVEVVGCRGRDADERQDADRRAKGQRDGPSPHPRSSLLAPSYHPDESVGALARAYAATVHQIPPPAGGWGCRPGPRAAPPCPTGSGRAHRGSVRSAL